MWGLLGAACVVGALGLSGSAPVVATVLAQATATPTATPYGGPYSLNNSRPQDGRLIGSTGMTVNQADLLSAWATAGLPVPTPVPQFTAVPYFTPLPTWTPFPSPVPYFTAVPQFTPLPTWTAVAVQAVQPNGAVAAQTPLAVALAGQQVAVRSTVVLPAQTPVAYTAGDVITSATPAALTFANACRTTGGSGYVVGVDLATDQSTNTANYRLWLYQSPPPTLVADNAANTLLFTNNAIRVGYIDIPSLATNTGSNTAAFSQNADVRLSYTCAGGSRSLSGVLEASSAFTPASAQTFDAGIRVAPD
jgi:hypothetical protein